VASPIGRLKSGKTMVGHLAIFFRIAAPDFCQDRPIQLSSLALASGRGSADNTALFQGE
jgi:hypothetical protein